MIALTHVDRKSYNSLLRDGKMDTADIRSKYGAGFVFRLQGILCAMTVRQASVDAYQEGFYIDSAQALYEVVQRYGYDSIFEDNGLERIKPGKPMLDAMLFSMCQAETNDYGGAS